MIGLSTKWNRGCFYFVATYACPFPDAISPTFERNFARLKYTGTDQYELSFMRHIGKWWPLLVGASLQDCLDSIRDDSSFQL